MTTIPTTPAHNCLTLRERIHQTEAERDKWKLDCLRVQGHLEEWKQSVKELEATMAILKEQLKADEETAFNLRCVIREVADYCGISTSLWPAAIAERLKQMKDDKDEIENMWEELTMVIGAQGPESDPLTGCDTNDEIHSRAINKIKLMIWWNNFDYMPPSNIETSISSVKDTIKILSNQQDAYFAQIASELQLTAQGREWLFDYMFNHSDSRTFREYLKDHGIQFESLIS